MVAIAIVAGMGGSGKRGVVSGIAAYIEKRTSCRNTSACYLVAVSHILVSLLVVLSDICRRQLQGHEHCTPFWWQSDCHIL